MKHMVLMVLNNPDYCMTLLDAWEAAGAPGITILESTGLVRMRHAHDGLRDDLPLVPRLTHLLRGSEEHHRTLFTVVDDEAAVEAILQATQQVFDQLEGEDLEESGIAFVLPVASSTVRATTRARNRRSGD